MTQSIKFLKIAGFKGFSDSTHIPFSKLTVLAGANSVGKSSIIQALLLSRISLGNGRQTKRNGQKIPLNGDYLLALGNTPQITNSSQMNFSFRFEKNESLLINYKVPVDKNYIIVKEITSDTSLNCLCFNNFHYLNAERIGPRPLYNNTVFEYPSTGYQGEFAVQLLVEGENFDTSERKNYHHVLNTKGKAANDLIERTNNLYTQTNLWMQYLIPHIDISANKLRETNHSIASIDSHTPPNVGFGISYILPIVVSGLIAEEGSMLIIENPEAHLHPFAQSRIAQFLSVIAASGVQVVVETHSEHIINGMRLASMSNFISHKKMLIDFLSKDDNGKINVKPIEINNMGDLTDFPIGFFDQVEQDLIQLTQMRRKRL